MLTPADPQTTALALDPTRPPHLGVMPGSGVPSPAPAPAAGPSPDRFALDCSVKEFILRSLASKEKDGEYEEEERVRVCMDNVLLYRGQHWMYATRDGQVKELEDSDDLQVVNLFGLIVEGKAKEWESSKPRVEITGAARDYRLEAAARLFEAVDRYVRRASIRAQFRQTEAKFGMLMKFYLRYSVPEVDESDERATRVKIPITEQREMYVGAALGCEACGYEWAEDDDLEGKGAGAPPPSSCPDCGQPAKELAPRFPFTREVQTGEEEVVMPRLRHFSVCPLNVKFDYRAKDFRESLYHIYDTLDRRCELENMYADADLSEVVPASNLPLRLRALAELERTTAGVEAVLYSDDFTADSKEDDLIRHRRFWLMPAAYKHRTVRAGEPETLCGITFMPGEPLGKYFPTGWLTVVVGDAEGNDAVIARMRDESKNKRWAGAPFSLDPTTAHGKGLEDLKTLTFTLDDMATLAASHYDRMGAPNRVVNTKVVDPDEFDGSTGKNIPMKESAPEDAKASDAVHLEQGAALGADFMGFMSALPLLIKEVGGVSPTTFGQPDPHNKTARGQELAAAASSSMQIPGLSIRAEEVEVETTYQNGEYVQEWWTEEDWALFEPEFGTEAIEAFQQARLRRDFEVEVAPGSWVPETREQEKENHAQFMELAGAAMQAGMPTAFVRELARLFNVQPAAFEPEADVRVAQVRLSRLREWADRAVKAGALEIQNPEAYQMMIMRILMEPDLVPRPLLENHPVHMEFYANQYKSLFDDKRANPVLLDLIDGMVQAHAMSGAGAAAAGNALATQATGPERDDADAREEKKADGEVRRQKQLKGAEGK